MAIILLSPLLGCHLEHLRTYTHLDDRATLNALAERGRRVHTVSGSGALTLTQRGNQSVRLTLAIALQPPNDARLRTWKFGQAVFDLTVTPAGAWLETQHDSHAASIHSAGINAAQVARGWALLGGGFFAQPGLATRDRGERMVVTGKAEGGATIVCEVDRATLAPRVYRLFDDAGKLRFTLSLNQYQDFDGLLWPSRITATSGSGVIDVAFDDVQINTDLPAAAFVPPRRAEKLP